MSVFDLISVFREILERAKKRPQLQIRREEVSVAQMVEHVKQVLRASPGPVPLDGFDWRLSLAAGVDRPVPGGAGDWYGCALCCFGKRILFAAITVARSKRFEEVLAATTAEELAAGLDDDSVKGKV